MIAAAILVVVPMALYAQSGPPDVLSALLTEVRQLRIALEQAATTTPRIQLLASRLAVQNDRLARASRDLDQVRQQLNGLIAANNNSTARLQELEVRLAAETDPAVRRQLAAEQRAQKQAADEEGAMEQRLRVQESELANALVTEQGAWIELNRRLDEIERELAPVRKQQ
jgi:hypothetical protein